MPRSFLLLISIFSVVLAALLVQSCKSQPQPVAAPAGSSKDIVVLADGATIVAPEGSRDRAMTDWMKSAEAAPARFAFEQSLFETGSAELSPQGLGDAAKLATVLRATPDARVALIGGGSGEASPEDASLAQRRREALAAFLKERGIGADRLELGAGNAGSADLELVAKRGTSLEPVLASSL
jgi:outer membrane protein OmpA-like peptidoglycan-associated protein